MIPTEGEFLEALRKVIAALDALGIEYALGGSFASSLYGEARATRDVDLVAAVAGRQAGPLVAALGPEFYADEAEIAAAALRQSSFNLIHRETMAKLDVFEQSQTPPTGLEDVRRRERWACRRQCDPVGPGLRDDGRRERGRLGVGYCAATSDQRLTPQRQRGDGAAGRAGTLTVRMAPDGTMDAYAGRAGSQ